MKSLFYASLFCLGHLLNAQVTRPIPTGNAKAVALEFSIPTQTQREALSILMDLTGTTHLTDISKVTITHLRKSGNRVFASTKSPTKKFTLTSPLSSPKGNHKFEVSLQIKSRADLFAQLAIRLTGYQRESDDKTTAIESPIPPLRLAALIHKRGDHNCHTFRIPRIVKTTNGDLLTVADMRYRSRQDLQGHMDIGLRISHDKGQTWLPPRPIMDMGKFGGEAGRSKRLLRSMHSYRWNKRRNFRSRLLDARETKHPPMARKRRSTRPWNQ